MTRAGGAAEPLLAVRGLQKSFGEAVVLAGVDLEIAAGEVHALLGENGAGKSTLVRILAGVLPADGGAVRLAGGGYAPADPQAAWAAGVATIHQELSLIGHLTVADNILLGRELTRRGLVDRSGRDRAAAAALELLQQADLPLAAEVRALSPAQRQLVEVARALARDVRVLVMDEPTSSLDGGDVDRLLAVVELLRGRGLAILYISHHLAEVRLACDRVTVLRDGRSVVCGRLADFTDDDLVRHMAGRPLGELFPSRSAAIGEPVLSVRELAGAIDGDDEGAPAAGPRGASFELRRGEILGIAGLCGAGRTELLETLFGLRRRRGGEALLHGAAVGGDVAARWRSGAGLLVEDRRGQGLSLRQSVAENLVLPSARSLRRGPLLDLGAVAAAGARWIQRLAIRCRDAAQATGELSGGNQQKVALARLLQAGCGVLLLDEPTRGIDVQSRQQIYALLAELAGQGAAILMVSSHLPELLGLCDRIAVMHEGVLGAPRPAADWTQESLLLAALGRQEGAA